MQIAAIKQYLTKEEVISILQAVGFEVKTNRNFRLRDDDKNPSASIYQAKDGSIRIKDFGTGFNGDVFDVLVEYVGMNIKEAKNFVMNHLGLSDSEVKIPKIEIKIQEPAYRTQEELRKIWDSFIPLYALDSKKASEIISRIIPIEYFKTAREEDRDEFLEVVRYDKKLDELVALTKTPKGEILSIRHRRKGGIKWKALSKTQANKYSQIRITDESDPVFIIEGTHDYLTAILLGINFIALPSKNYKTFKVDELSLLKGNKWDFIVLPDLDYKNEQDESYKKLKKELQQNIINLIQQLEPVGRSISVWDLRKKFSHFKDIEKVKDLSDLCSISDLYDSVYLKVFHLLACFIALQSNEEATQDIKKGV
ncbi:MULTISPECIES: hypothetical protein [unclassified Lebetimonas]|uniref:hypothetical protein n=1 Tax=unclassified Lebetimonas TaxID=2648158 RepID=UPI000466DAB0|nr:MULTISPECIES: hypothetical protein [unclassified Lebetimonas]